jgi:hypothetical protein
LSEGEARLGDSRQLAGGGLGINGTRLIAEPIAIVEELYDVARLEFASLPKRAMDEWLAAHPQNAGDAHHYDLADYGLDRATVEHALTDYLARFQPGVEP